MTIQARGLSVLLTALTLGACATSRPPAPQPPQPPSVAAFAVAVHDARSGAAIEAARVDVQWTETTDDGRTNADGYLLLTGPVGGDHVVEVHAEGYAPWSAVVSLTAAPQQIAVALAPVSVPPPIAPQRLVGRLRIEGGCYRDDTGCVLPVYAHAGDLFSVYVRTPDRARAELDAIARAGYHGLRTWSTLGCDGGTCSPGQYWYGREVGPLVTPDYRGQVRAFFADVRDRGLRLVWSQGDVRALGDRRAAMTLFAEEDGGVLDWIDCGNEAYQTGEPDPRRLAECVGYYASAGGRALKTLTSADGDPTPHDIDRWSLPPADAFDVHSWRGGHSWDKRRHIWGYTYCGEGCPRLSFGIGSEPPGNGARVSVTSNKHELDDEAVALLGVASMLGRQAFVWFSGEGVILDRGLSVEAGWISTPRAVALVPRDVMTYRISHHSGATWASVRVLESQGDVRVDGRISEDGRFAYTIDGPPGSYRLRVARSFAGQLCHPGTGVCEDVSARAGESLPVSFTRGRIFIGRTQ